MHRVLSHSMMKYMSSTEDSFISIGIQKSLYKEQTTKTVLVFLCGAIGFAFSLPLIFFCNAIDKWLWGRIKCDAEHLSFFHWWNANAARALAHWHQSTPPNRGSDSLPDTATYAKFGWSPINTQRSCGRHVNLARFKFHITARSQWVMDINSESNTSLSGHHHRFHHHRFHHHRYNLQPILILPPLPPFLPIHGLLQSVRCDKIPFCCVCFLNSLEILKCVIRKKRRRSKATSDSASVGWMGN